MSSTTQLLQKLVHQPLLLLQQLNPHCPLQGSSCQLGMLAPGCRDQICATRESGETSTEIQGVDSTQRWRAEITDQIPHNLMCSNDSQMLTEIWDVACDSASGSPQKRAKISRHTSWSHTDTRSKSGWAIVKPFSYVSSGETDFRIFTICLNFG